MNQRIPNTFGLNVFAKQVITITSIDELCKVWRDNHANYPIMVIGEGSNVLFTCDFDGIIVVNRIKGIEIQETKTQWLLTVGAGEIWHELVKYTVTKGIGGLENLALIPGCVGSAPIQNIGAYGIEFQKVASYVDLLELETGNIIRITDGQYGYRDSIFKRQYAVGYVVVSVGICLKKPWQPILIYGELKKLTATQVTPELIFDKICEIRQQKLPNPNIIGNGGSFFKNPVVDNSLADRLLANHPNMPIYPQDNGKMKLAAGWLIEQCGLKNHQIGGAAVHADQALVLINKKNAKPQDIIELACYIRKTVQDKFAVELSPEIRFISREGEVDGDNYLSE